MSETECVQAVRRFNRFYTKQIGVLQEGLLDSPFSLSEVRVLYELAHRERATAAELVRDLGLDAGYLSRILTRFETQGLLRKVPSESDGRQSVLSLTAKGRKAFAPLDNRSDNQVQAMLTNLSTEDQERLAAAMSTIEGLLAPESENKSPYIIRTHQPGDLGWIVHRHGALYSREYGLNDNFEALVAEIAAHFLRNFDSKRERCWIAERDGENLGCVCLVRECDEVAKLRVLLVEPKARGLGLGHRLVAECIRFARQAGYRKIILWTSAALVAARCVYEKAGFQLVEEKRHNMFGPDWVGQTWELKL
jgi:DNA-binding MarR family transcriptional regulator/N-acetylglutamate synthase-like GNAT family acetyltransferase